MQLNPKTNLYVSTSRVIGGKTTQTTRLGAGVTGEQGEGAFTERKVKVTIDNVDERTTAEKLVASAAHLIRKASVATMLGYLGPREKLPQIEADFAELRKRADTFNGWATTCRVQITFLSVEISVALGPEAARALADHVRDELTTLRAQLRAGDDSGTRATLLRAKNLSTLSVGAMAQAIAFAIDEGREALKTLRERVKANETPESAGKALDLSMIEAGIANFTYEGQPEAQGADAGAQGAHLSLVGGA